jgi:hypothetical protein
MPAGRQHNCTTLCARAVLEPHASKEGRQIRGRIGLTVVWAVLLLCSGASSAQERWVYRHNGPGNGQDWGNSIVVGSDGNLYAAGLSWGSASSGDLVVVSLTDSGGERWVYRADGAGSLLDWANSIIMGSDGNLYTAGALYGSGTSYDFAVLSLSSSGAERWVYVYDGPASGEDWANSIVMGPDGNLYAAGYSLGSGTEYDLTIVSLADSGAERWVYRYNGPGNGEDWGSSIIAGPDGNLYAAGYSLGVATNEDFTVASLSPSGAERWIYRYDGAASGTDKAASIVMGLDGNLYASGYSAESGVYSDLAVVSLTLSGSERWVYLYDGPASGDDWANWITTGSDSSLVAAGYSLGNGTYADFTVVSVSTSGAERWTYRYDGPGGADDEAYSVVTGSDGNLYAAGNSTGSGSWFDFTVVSLSPSGGERWVYRYDGPGDNYDYAYSIAAGADGNVYATGYSTGSGTSGDLAVVSLSGDVGVNETHCRAHQSPALQVSACPLDGYRGMRIDYSLPEACLVDLSVYDVAGRLVRDLVDVREESGKKTVLWDGKDAEQRPVASGPYFARLDACGCVASCKFVLF